MTTPPGVPDDLAAHIFDRAAHGEPPPGVPRDIVEHENEQDSFSTRPAGVPEDLDLALAAEPSVPDVEEHPGEARYVRDDREVSDAPRSDALDIDDRDTGSDDPRRHRPDDDSSTHQ